MSCVPHDRGFCLYNSEAGGKQENVTSRIGYTGKGMIWGTSVDGLDQSMVSLHWMLPLASKDIWVAVHGRKKTLSQEELSKVEVDVSTLAFPPTLPKRKASQHKFMVGIRLYRGREVIPYLVQSTKTPKVVPSRQQLKEP